MSSLKKLHLYQCTSLRRVPEFGECMKQLSILTMRYLPQMESGACDCSGVLLSHGCFVGLKELELTGCTALCCILNSTHGLESLRVEDWPESKSIGALLGSLSHLTSLSTLSLERCFHTYEEPTPYYDLAHLALLTDLNLTFNSFLRVPLSIHQLPRLKCLRLYSCYELRGLPELPSSLRELHARGCDSLDASNVNDVISKACSVFAESSTQDPEDILKLQIGGKEIPAWFDHQEEGDEVSISFPHNCPSTETLALALCFQFTLWDTWYKDDESVTVTCNGKEFINKSLLKTPFFENDVFLCIVCLNGYYLSKLLCQPNCFQMLTPNREVKRCGARWVCKQDILDFKKAKSKTRKRKATL